MDDPKQHVIDTLKGANNILVTVRSSPSIDQLASCIALTLVLNALGKHGTAVFSGQVPSVLEFLEPEKTIEKNTDSLQDFIISLDKAKADKLRYKVEDDVVRIFITPYRTSISDKDLEFGQGDFNVDVVVALGVHIQDDLDEAITAHGRILHDATVISVNTEGGVSEDLGSINWIDPNVSSLSEMIASLAGQLGKEDAVDNQVATALLTGIVAETERFGNAKTKPSTMEVAAKLLAAGANQELVATKLAEPEQPQASLDQDGPADDTSFIESLVPKDDGGTLEIEHPANEERDDQPSQADLTSESGAPDQPAGEVPPVFGFEQPAAESQPSDQPALQANVEPQPQSEEAAALDYLQSRKVEVDRRPRIEPLRGHGEYLSDSSGGTSKPSDMASADEKAAEDELDNTRFALTPPTMGGTLTANMPQEQASATPTISKHGESSPILSHEKIHMPAPDALIEPTINNGTSETAKSEAPQEAPKTDEADHSAHAHEVKPEAPAEPQAIAPSEMSSEPADTSAESTESLIAPAFDIEASAPAAHEAQAPAAADKPQPTDAAPQTLADLEREVRNVHAELTGAADMPKPAGQTVALPSPQQPSPAPASSGPASPPPPVPPPLPPLPNAAS